MRYFLIAYTGTSENNTALHFGTLAFESKEFPSQKRIAQEAIEFGDGRQNIVIISIHEFKTLADFNAYTAD